MNHLEYERYYEGVGLRYKHEVLHPTSEGGNLGQYVAPNDTEGAFGQLYGNLLSPGNALKKPQRLAERG